MKIKKINYIFIASTICTRNSGQHRDEGGSFKKQCGCLTHADNKKTILCKVSSSIKRLNTYQELVAKKLINVRAKHVCSDCLNGKCNVCYKCFGSFPKSDVKCPQCGINMERYKNDYDPYFRTESKHPIMKPSMDVGEPCMVNPSSYEALLEVMDHVKKTCSFGSNKERKWTVLASDGVPYVLASEIQDNLKQCCCCGLEITWQKLKSN